MEAFRSTLDEITGADLILHVIDASSPEFEGQIDAVCEVLDQIGAESIAAIEVFNKCDLLDAETLAGLRRRFPHAQFVSARTGEGIDGLVTALATAASAADAKLDVVIPYQRGDLVSLAHERCHIISESHEADGTHIQMLAAPAFAAAFREFSA